MITREAYLEQVEAQLNAWSATIERLKAKIGATQSPAAAEFQQQLGTLSTKQAVVQQKLVTLKHASGTSWVERKYEVDNAMAELHQSFTQAKETVRKAGEEGLSWAKGMADEHFIQSIGWAEGIATEDKVESKGWVEGYSKE